MASKKSQIFVFDLILSIVIIVVSVILVFSFFTTTIDNVDIYEYNYEILTGITQTKINSLNDDQIRDFFIENKIKNIENTVAQQISDFYYLGQNDDAENLTRIFIKDYALSSVNINITLNNGTEEYELYSKKAKSEVSFEDSTIASVTKRNIFGFLNTSDYYGPYELKIKLWI
ncbi:MAG: hypothetical protein ACOCXG_05090 [Nanoarchaeota archaeon]